MERNGNLGRADPTHTEKSLKHELEEQNKVELPKEPFENKAESSLSYLAGRTTLRSGKTQMEAVIRYLDFFNYSKVRALGWKG